MWVETRPSINGLRRIHDGNRYLHETSSPNEDGLSYWLLGTAFQQIGDVPISLDDAIAFADRQQAGQVGQASLAKRLVEALRDARPIVADATGCASPTPALGKPSTLELLKRIDALIKEAASRP